MYENSESKVFKNIKFWMTYLIIDRRIYYKQMYTRLFDFYDKYY